MTAGRWRWCLLLCTVQQTLYFLTGIHIRDGPPDQNRKFNQEKNQTPNSAIKKPLNISTPVPRISWRHPWSYPCAGNSAEMLLARYNTPHPPGITETFISIYYLHENVSSCYSFSLTMATCMDCLSASLYTATERTPIFLAVRITRHAISPLLAMRTFSIRPAHRETTPISIIMNYNNHKH